MFSRRRLAITTILLGVVMLFAFAQGAFADASDGYVYTIGADGKATIDWYEPASPGGAVVIPDTLPVAGGSQVATIGPEAFAGRTDITTVSVPETVVSIGRGAFLGCNRLWSVTFQGTSQLETIGDYAFQYCSSLMLAALPDGVTSIGASAFEQCASLGAMDLPDGLLGIGSSAFLGCTSLTTADLPPGLVFLGGYAFKGCTSLLAADVPASVGDISNGVFLDCTSLTSLTLAEGVEIIGDEAFSGCTSLPELPIPSTVATIGADAFSRCTSVEQVRIPSGVTYLGPYAFHGCTSLESVYLPGSLTAILEGTFAYCSDLRTATIPSSVTRIEKRAFYRCTSLESLNMTLDGELVEIGESAFQYCSDLTTVTIPSSVKESIESYAFADCSNLVSANFLGHEPVIFGAGVFDNAAAEFTVRYVEGKRWFATPPAEWFGYRTGYCDEAGNPLTWTLTYLFTENGTVSGINPQSIRTGENGAPVTAVPDEGYEFQGWSDGETESTRTDTGVSTDITVQAIFGLRVHTLTYAAEPGGMIVGTSRQYVEHGEDGAPVEAVPSPGYHFVRWDDGSTDNPRTDKDVTSPLSVTAEFAASAYSGTWGDFEYTVYDGVATIDRYVGPAGAVIVPSKIPDPITGFPVVAIGREAFAGRDDVTAVTIPDSVVEIRRGAFLGCTNLSSVVLNPTSGLRSIGNSAFEYCESLTGISLPSGLLTIGSSAFTNCTDLTAIAIPDTVTSIGNGAFLGCTALQSATLSANLTDLGERAFQGCVSLETVNIPDTLTQISQAAFLDCTSLETVVIPEGIEVIGDYAFSGCTGLTSVSIPESVHTIGSWAFYYCSALPAIDLPGALRTIGDYAFGGCTSLASVVIPGSVDAMGIYAFYYCTSLESVTLSSGLTALAPGTFASCESLASITLPAGIESIGESAFAYASSLSTVTVPSSVTEIGAMAFYRNTSLADLRFTLDSRLGVIGASAFESCSNLTSATVPASVATVGDRAFADCERLSHLAFLGNAPDTGIAAFEGATEDFTVYFVRGRMGFPPPPGPWMPTGAEAGGSYITGYCDPTGRPLTRTLIYRADEGGVIVGPNPQSVAIGSNGATVTAEPLPGYQFAEWSDGSTVNPRRDMNVTANIIVTAKFEPRLYTLAYTAGAHGSISGVSPQSVPSGGDGTPVEAIADPGWEFVEWSDGSTANPRTDTNVTADIDVTATFALAPYSSTNGLFNYTIANGEATVDLYIGPGGVPVVIPDTFDGFPVVAIGSDAFLGRFNLPSVTIPDGTRRIDARAFLGCIGLTSVDMPDSITYIGDQAFSNCLSLPSIDLPSGLTVLGAGAFEDCAALTAIDLPDTLTSVGASAFEGCTGLLSVRLPAAIQGIGARAFAGSSSLTTVTIPATLTNLGSQAFLGCSDLLYASFLGSAPMTGANAFDGADADFTVRFIPGRVGFARPPGPWVPTGNPTGGSYRTGYCDINGIPTTYTLTYLTETGGTIAGASVQTVFIGGNGLTVRAAADAGYRFTGWSDGVMTAERTDGPVVADRTVTARFELLEYTLTYLAGPGGSISGDDAQTVKYGFDGTPVTAVPSTGYHFVRWSDGSTDNPRRDLAITGDLTVQAEFEEDAYQETDGPWTYTVDGGKATIDSYDQGAPGGPLSIPATLGDAPGFPVVAIGPEVFAGRVDITSVIIPDSVRTVGRGAFLGCTELTAVGLGVDSELRTIGDYAFEYCYALTDITIPGMVASIGDGAFEYCTSLDAIDIPGSVRTIGRGAFLGCESLKSIYIPEGVASIGDRAFQGCVSLTSAIIRGTVRSIGASAFMDCTSLTTLELWRGIRTIGDSAFSGCTALTGVTIPGTVTTIGASAFEYCTSLVTLELLRGIEAIGESAFARCDALTGVMIPDTVKTVGPAAFRDCTSLRSLWLSSGMSMIDVSTFEGCTSLLNVVIPGGVVEVNDRAFFGCTSLRTAVIPSSLMRIGVSAFEACESLTKIYMTLDSRIDVIADYAFYGCTSLTSVIIPAETDSIGIEAFGSCGQLDIASFLGDAPVMDVDVFGGAAPSFTVFFVKGKKGYATPPGPWLPTGDEEGGGYVTGYCDPTGRPLARGFLLRYSAGAHGDISGTTPQYVVPGGSGTPVTAVADYGYHFVRWSDGSTANPRTDSNVTAHANLVAEFEINTYTLRYAPGVGGRLKGATTQSVPHGGTGESVEAIDGAGYTFVKWSDGRRERARQDKDVTSDITVVAEFAKIELVYTLSYTAETGGWIRTAAGDLLTSTTQQVGYGANGTPVTAVPSTGYTFVRWSDGSTANPRTETNVTGNASYDAIFQYDGSDPDGGHEAFTVTYLAGPGGAISGNAAQVIIGGASGNPVTAVPYTGYHFVRWSDGSTANPRTDTNVTANKTVTAEFAANIYTLSYLAEPGGRIVGTNPQTVAHGAAASPVTAVPDTGYRFVMWSDGLANAVRTSDHYVTSDKTVTAIFTPLTYSLTYRAGAGGRVTGATGQVVSHGSSGTLVSAVPDTGYRFVRWSDGSTDNPRTDTAVVADKTVTAEFAVAVGRAVITRTPNKSSVTYTRKNGGARFTLSAVIRDVSGGALFGRTVYLQTSTNGKTWKKTYKLVTSTSGKVSRRFTVSSKQTTYYRWYVPATKGVVNKTYSPSTKVRVK